ncbi:hypothetical protein GN956_G11592 [Arapaima gigas]
MDGSPPRSRAAWSGSRETQTGGVTEVVLDVGGAGGQREPAEMQSGATLISPHSVPDVVAPGMKLLQGGPTAAGVLTLRGESGRPGLLLAAFLLLALVLVVSVVLSSYAVYLTAQTSEKVGVLSGSGVEKKYLEELKRWKAFVVQHLDGSGDGFTSAE